MKQILKRSLLAAMSGATQRTAVLLGSAAGDDGALLALRAPYRVTGPVLAIDFLADGTGELRASFAGLTGKGASACLVAPYDAPGRLTVRLDDGEVAFNGRALGSVTAGQAVTARRFGCTFELRTTAGETRTRATSHYLPRDGQAVEASYYHGEDYADYEAESASVHAEIVDLLRRYGARGPVFEIGCATGGTLAALRREGFEVCGIDSSAWAVERARQRLGDVVWAGDAERGSWPDPVARRAPFGALVLASVLEHFAQPAQVLADLTALAAPGAVLAIITANGDSLTHRIFGPDWEGYFDWTHKSVDAISPRALRGWLQQRGWRVEMLRTWHVWDGCADPTHATLREWCAADARFRALLTERELGDFITCVATRA